MRYLILSILLSVYPVWGADEYFLVWHSEKGN